MIISINTYYDTVQFTGVVRYEDHHNTLHVTTFHDGRKQADQPCPKCLTGIARVSMFYAPDMKRNWWECNSCGHRYV